MQAMCTSTSQQLLFLSPLLLKAKVAKTRLKEVLQNISYSNVLKVNLINTYLKPLAAQELRVLSIKMLI